MSAGWWRRNALALAALVVLIPVGVWAFDTIEFGSVRNAQRDVPADSGTLVGDWKFEVPEITSIDPEEIGAPSGSDPVVVRVRVAPGQDAIQCSVPVLIDPETGREWWPNYSLDWTRDDDELGFCPSATDDGGSAVPFDLSGLVLLPGDAPDRLLVAITSSRDTDAVATDVRFDVTR